MAPRTLLHTGKGGVGKTTVAAATARHAAAAGRRTLLVSTDPAHSLADVLDTPVGPEPTAVAPRLWAQEIDAQRELERRGAAPDWLAGLLGDAQERVAPEGLTVPPGLDELLRLLAIGEHFAAGDYDVLVVDCAATGETLRLLAFPDIARRSLQRGTAGPRDPRPDAAAGGDLLRDLVAVNEVLADHAHTSVRLVTAPERVVAAETRRALTHLGLYGLRTDAVVVNRVVPEEAGPWLARLRDRQARQLAAIAADVAPIPVLVAPFSPDELVGPAALDRLGRTLLDGHDDARAPRSEPAGPEPELIVTRTGATLRLTLPFVAAEDVRLRQAGPELTVRAGGHQRILALPPALADYRPGGATVRDGALLVEFDRAGAPVPDA